MFEEYATAIQQRYPQIHISGGNYPPGPTKQMIAQVLSTLKWVVLGTIIFGEKVQLWSMLGMAPPAAYTWTQDNKIVSCIATFFLCNGIENSLIQTGAFEVELNGMPIWSKLKAGRIPQGNELFEIIENQMQLSTPDMKNKFPGSVPVGDFNYDKSETKKEEEDDSQEEEDDEENKAEDEEEDEGVEDALEGEEDNSKTKEEKVEDAFKDIDAEIDG